MLDITDKLSILNQIYDIYDTFAETRDTACQRGCALCCTRNVTLTTLEGVAVIDGMNPADRAKLMASIDACADLPRFRPQLTINLMATLCAAGKDLPDETIDPEWGKCPILADDTCPIYPVRPFGCRCMMSSRTCTESGAAAMEPLILTVNTVCQQMIEHIDIMGCTGNFTDILRALGSGENRDRYVRGRLLCQGLDLLPNRPLKVLMVPPEHRERIAPILQRLSEIQTA